MWHSSFVMQKEPGKRLKEETRRIIGVLWSGDHLFEGTVETLELLRSKGKELLPPRPNRTPFGPRP